MIIPFFHPVCKRVSCLSTGNKPTFLFPFFVENTYNFRRLTIPRRTPQVAGEPASPFPRPAEGRWHGRKLPAEWREKGGRKHPCGALCVPRRCCRLLCCVGSAPARHFVFSPAGLGGGWLASPDVRREKGVDESRRRFSGGFVMGRCDSRAKRLSGMREKGGGPNGPPPKLHDSAREWECNCAQCYPPSSN